MLLAPPPGAVALLQRGLSPGSQPLHEQRLSPKELPHLLSSMPCDVAIRSRDLRLYLFDPSPAVVPSRWTQGAEMNPNGSQIWGTSDRTERSDETAQCKAWPRMLQK